MHRYIYIFDRAYHFLMAIIMNNCTTIIYILKKNMSLGSIFLQRSFFVDEEIYRILYANMVEIRSKRGELKRAERRNDLNQSLNGESIVEGNTRKGGRVSVGGL